MFSIDCLNTNESFQQFRADVKSGMSFAVTGLLTILRLLLVQKTHEISGKKVLFITSTEQNALKYQSDFKRAFGVDASLLPFQNISMYESVASNVYDYAEQIKILHEKPEFIIAPAKTLLEKFPNETFFKNNSIKIKIGDEIDLKDFSQKLVNLGYKRSTMVSDIAEFSIRGDIADVFSLDKNPVRIELWGDEVVDIRYFNNETQKSIEKVKEIEILPVYKFVLPQDRVLKDVPKEIVEQVENEGYFEGIEVYQNYFNRELVSVLDYFKDYTIILDETSEVYAKIEFIDENFTKQLQENLKLGLNYELDGLNHTTYDEFIRQLAGFVKIGLNNFLDGETDEIVEFNTQPVKNFAANLDEIAQFINEKTSLNSERTTTYNIIIATDYPERVKEILKEREVFAEIEYTESISCHGGILEDFDTIILTDRELFNKRSKEVTSTKRSYYKEKPEFIESINDIKEGEYVVHSIHGVGIYKGLTQQEIDGQLKDYLTIEYASKDRLHIPAEQINLLCRYRGSGNIKPKLSRMGGKDWENTKAKVKKEVEQVAYDLLRLYARRKMQKGIQFLPDTTWQVEMEEAFE